MNRSAVVFSGFAIAALAAAAPAQGRCSAREAAHLLAFDGAARDVFGLHVAIDGDTAIAGAPGRDTEPGPIGGQGAAYVYVASGGGWTLQAGLTASNRQPLDQFGVAVAIDGDTAVVGAYRPGGSAPGSVYVFERSGSTWTQVAELTASDGVPFDYFGICAAIQGDTILVGAPRADTARGIDAGAVYVFTRNGSHWHQRAKLTASDGGPEDRFGYAVTLDASTVVVGAALDDDAPGGPVVHNCGTAYVFTGSGSSWARQATLAAPSAGFRAQFGNSVAIRGDTLFVGEPYRNTVAGQELGAAYVFVRQGTVWALQATVAAADGAPEDHFGYDLAFDGDLALISAPWHDAGAGPRSGAVYVYGRDGSAWIERNRFGAADGAPADTFGTAVAIDGRRAVVGAVFDDTPAGADAGSAYIFDPLCSEATYTIFGQGCQGSAGVPALVPGNLPVLGSTFVLELQNLPASAFAVMLTGFSDSIWNGVPLPIGLGGFGLPGCTLFVSADTAQLLPVAGNAATWSVALPSDPALAGSRFFNQGISLENGAAAAVSAAGVGTLR